MQQRRGAHAWLAERFGLFGDAAWTFVTAAVLVSINAWLAIVLRSALVFASLGPIIFQLVDQPKSAASSPRSAILGNGVALVIGYACLAVFGLAHAPPITVTGVTVPRAVAAGAALGLTGAVVALARALHPPAGSTSLLVTLGFVHQPLSLLVMFAGVVLVVVTGFALNRIGGIDVPIWKSTEV